MNSKNHPEFVLQDGLVYLNHAAVAPWPKRTAAAVAAFAEENSLFGSQQYLQWLEKEESLRKQFQQLLNAPSPDDIALVKNTSEAISFVAYGLDWQSGDNIVSCDQEFPSNRIPWESLANQGVVLRQANLDGPKSPEVAILDLVDQHTRLITVSSIQFATGISLDLERIGRYCKSNNILFCVDAIQSLGAMQFDVQACHADFVMADGHKWMLGPEGLGVFYTTPMARDRLRLTQYGWHMLKNIHNYENVPWEIHPTAKRFECGSPNMLGIHALSTSLALLLETGMPEVERLILQNAQYLRDNIQQNPQLELISNRHANDKSGIICFRHKFLSNKQLFALLQKNGVLCAMRGPGIRFSPHFYNTQSELEHALECIQNA